MGTKALSGVTLLAFMSMATLAAPVNSPPAGRKLVEAVKEGDHDAMRFLLKQHADVNTAQPDGATALAWAAHWDDLETANLLIHAGANLNAANIYGVTPLSLACTNGNAAMVEMLLKAGANPNAALTTGETVLMTCAGTGNSDAVKSLLAHGADANAKEARKGQTALMWAVAEKYPAAVRILVEHGADVSARSKGGSTPLLFAARLGDVDSARILITAGAKLNEAAPDGMNALLLASASGREAFAMFLLDQGADPNATDGSGNTAMHYALFKGITILGTVAFTSYSSYLWRPDMSELVEALLAHGANPNARLGKVPAKISVSQRVVSMIGATPFLLAATTGDVSLMRLLAASGADPLLRTKDNTTPLMVAAGAGRTHDHSEEESKGALEAVRLAVELGNDVNAVNDDGQTALHAAATMGADVIIQFLVDKGAKVNVMDKYDQTPLSIAEAIVPTALKPRMTLINSSFRPTLVRKSTVELLRKLGATPVTVPVAQRSDASPGRTNQ